MNYLDKLIACDKGELKKKVKKEIPSKRLSKLLGEDVNIEITKISPRRFAEIQEDYSPSGESNYDGLLAICSEGITYPDLTNERLLESFDCFTVTDLIEKLFDSEIFEIATEIVALDENLRTENGENDDKIKKL